MKYILYLGFLTIALTSQADEIERQLWTTTNLSHQLENSLFTAGVEGIYRHSFTKEKTVVTSLRALGSYQLTDATRLTLIYENREGETSASNEQRIAQQIQTKFGFEKLDLSVRWRQEQRLFKDESQWLHRSRLQLRSDFKAQFFSQTSPFAANEVLYLNNSVGSRSAGSLENRLTLGLTTKWKEGSLRLDWGLMDRRSYVKSEETRSEIAVLNLGISI